MSSVENRTHDPIDRLAEDFLERYRHGERPSVSEYAKQFPDVADQVADLIQVLLWMEKLREDQDDHPAETHESIPEQLGEYRIVREIGRGGMGVVYEAEQGELGRQVALKVLPSTALLKPIQLQRFRREAQAIARLRHPNIVPIYGEGTQDGIYYYAMQHIPGQGLDGVIKKVRRERERNQNPDTVNDKLDEPPRSTLPSYRNPQEYSLAIARLGLEIADALAHAHSLGILHRDIKPSNILLDKNGKAWLSDFGLAQDDATDSLTCTGDVVGTLRYMAPERFKGHGDARSDLYSLGLTLYELLALEPAFKAADRAKLVHQILSEEPDLASSSQAGVPRDLETIVLKAIAKEPAHRYDSANALADDLRRFLSDRPVTARRLNWWQRTGRWVRHNSAVSIAACLAFTALLGGLAATYWQWQRAEVESAEKWAVAEREKGQRQAAEKNAAFAWHMLESILRSVNNGNTATTEELRRSVYNQAFKIHKEYFSNITDAPRSFELGIISFELGGMLNKSMETDKARECFRQAISCLEASLKAQPDNRAAKKYLALGWGSLARSLQETNAAAALPSVENAIGLLQTLTQESPGDNELHFRLVYNMETLARVRRKTGGDWEAPLRDARGFISQYKAVANRPTGLELSTFADYHCLFASILREDRRLDDALREANAAHQYCVQLTRDHPGADVYLAQFYKCSSTLGLIYKDQNDYVRAEDLHRQNCEILRGLIQRDPKESTQLHSSLGAELNNLALVMARRGQINTGLETLAEAVEEQRLALQKNPNHPKFLEFLYLHHKNRTALFLQTRDHSQATAAAKGLGALKYGKGTNHFDCAFYLCRAASLLDQDFSLAAHERAARIKENYDIAVTELQIAVQQGYSDQSKLRSSAFSGLNKRPDYQKLLADVSATTISK